MQMNIKYYVVSKDHTHIKIKLVDIVENKFITWYDINKIYSNKYFLTLMINFLSNYKTNPFEEYYLEFNPVSASKITATDFEFVIIGTQGFGSNADIKTFGESRLNTGTNDIIWFPNPSNNAILITPCYNHINQLRDYIHVGNFMRSNNNQQKINLIKTMFEIYFDLLSKIKSTQNLWLSTHGKGVNWLHVRIDYIPKYISHQEYLK